MHEQLRPLRSDNSGWKHNVLPDNEWHPLSGWPLLVIGELAEATDRPALLLYANRAKALWRQSLFFALAAGSDEESPAFSWSGHAETTDVTAMAETLQDRSPKEIVSASIGDIPAGLGVLRRIGMHPLRADTYRAIHKWHREPGRDHYRCDLLQRLHSLDQERLDAISVLDRLLMVPAVIPFVQKEKDALQLNSALALIRGLCGSATDEALWVSSRELHGEKTVNAWVESWLRRADQLPVPFDGDQECRPLRTGADLQDAGQRFKNCLGNECLAAVIGGRVSVVEYLPDPAVVLLGRLADGHWVVGSVHGPRNLPVTDDLVRRVKTKVSSFGPHIHIAAEVEPNKLGILRKYFGCYDPFDLEWLGLD